MFQHERLPVLKDHCKKRGSSYVVFVVVIVIIQLNQKNTPKHFVNRGRDLKSVEQCFSNFGKTSRQEEQKKVKPRNTKNLF